MLSTIDAHAEELPPPSTLPGLRCGDGDDQHFIDLAVAADARWLLRRDKVPLELARCAALLGVAVLRPAGFVAAD